MFGTGNAIDRFATNAIVGNKAATIIKKHKELLEDAGLNVDLKKMTTDPINNQRIQSIVAGSLRANDRLKEAGLIESRKCSYCNNHNATLRHIVWQCDKWKEARQPYVDTIHHYIDKVADRDNDRRQRIMDLLAKPCVHNCGVMLESDYFVQGGAKIPTKQARYCQQNVELSGLNARQTEALDKD